ncbi:MAG: phosphoglycerate kinase [Nanobdellota archaeon]
MARYTDKKVLIRVEFNVPLDKKGKIKDNSRIKRAIPTIKKILSQKPRQLIIMTHLGRPKNKETHLKTDILAKELETLLRRKVYKTDYCGENPLPTKNIIMLENLRFYEGEKKGSRKFAKQLASLADIYVNESFGTCHRKDSSMYLVPQYFPENRRFAGELLKNEIKKLDKVNKSKNITVMVGFAKISDKIKILSKLLKKSDKTLIGGLVVFSFLKAKGYKVGKVECSEEDVQLAKKLLKKHADRIILPTDFTGKKGKRKYECSHDNIPDDFIGYDIGGNSIELFKNTLKSSKLVFWNGPLGYFEKKPFDHATNKISEYLAKNSQNIKTVIGGGDTASAVYESGFANKMYHISTGGGASLEYIEKGTLPALKWLKV